MWLESRVVDGEVGLTVDSSLFLFVFSLAGNILSLSH